MTRLFHISDIHFGAEDSAALDWFRRTALAERPDAVIVTGDLTMRARAREFAAAADWIRSLDLPVAIGVGNHDLPYFNLAARFTMPYRRYRALAASIDRPLEGEGVAVVPLKTTARAQLRLNWSKGHVSSEALRDTLTQIDAVPSGDIVLVAAHHPLMEGDTLMDARTRGGPAALKELALAGVDAVLSGHVHDPFDRPCEVAGRVVRLIGAGTLSERLRSTPPSFNELRVDKDGIDVRVRALE